MTLAVDRAIKPQHRQNKTDFRQVIQLVNWQLRGILRCQFFLEENVFSPLVLKYAGEWQKEARYGFCWPSELFWVERTPSRKTCQKAQPSVAENRALKWLWWWWWWFLPNDFFVPKIFFLRIWRQWRLVARTICNQQSSKLRTKRVQRKDDMTEAQVEAKIYNIESGNMKGHKNKERRKLKKRKRKNKKRNNRKIRSNLVIGSYLVIARSDFLVVLRLNVPVNNFSVMSGRSHRFLGN